VRERKRVASLNNYSHPIAVFFGSVFSSWKFVGTGILAVGMCAGCTGSGGGGINSTSDTTMRVFMEFAGAAPVGISIDGNSVATSVDYQGSLGPLAESSGSHQLAITTVGAGKPDWDSTNKLTADTQSSFIFYGWCPFSNGLITMTDDTTAGRNSQAKLRLVDAASSLTGFDAYIVASGASPSGTPTFSNLSLGLNDVSGYDTLAADTYEVYFVVSDTTQSIYNTSSVLGVSQNRTLMLLNDWQPSFCDLSTYTSITIADLN
jgi:hypothetical protein